MNTEKEKTKWYQTVSTKMIVLAFIALILLIPLEMVKDVIHERISYSNQVKSEIAGMWSGSQTVAGPVLNVPIQKYVETKDGNTLVTDLVHIMPDELDITGNVAPEIRKKGIYRTVVYSSDLAINGTFDMPDLSAYSDYYIVWEDAYFTFGISDNRGIKGDLELLINKIPLTPRPGVQDHQIFESGITFGIKGDSVPASFPFKMNLKLNGSDDLSFLPIGKNTRINLNSSWADPAFNGDFLPYDREVTKEGFKAKWTVTELNRTFPQVWKGSEYNVNKQHVGVEFLLLADHYQKSLRSAKYGILFIALTFLVLVFAELFYKNKVQVFHYILVGFALILFFSMLTALSEHIGFNPAYLVSVILIVSAIWYFTRGFIQSGRMAIILNGILLLFYVFIFILLSLKDFAYLAGNIGLFIILTAIMGVSRKLKINDK